MLRALYTSATGMKAQELLIDNTANNLANVNTTGFKRSHVEFADLIYTTLDQPGQEVASGQSTPVGLQVGSGARAVATSKVFSPGSFAQTDNPLDVAIEGDGFFKVLLPNGDERYTRDGAFRIDGAGQLVTAAGYRVDPPVTVSSGVSLSRLKVGSDGTVTATPADDPNGSVTLGRLQITTFLNPPGLSSEGGNLYAETAASGQKSAGDPGTDGRGMLRGGFLEGSNVQVVTELISLISAQRAYEVNSRAIRAGDEMLSTSNDIVR
ncbi:MAG: flagellar basal-body rod protein FlgG [Planctomycetaceae bacterium]|nr:flagellar basal-body rod protein FlgG [Planctomycetaceae bacterium]